MVIQAWILLIVYIISTAISAYLLRKSSPGLIAGFVIGWLVFICFLVYDTNCLVQGDCRVWSWVRTFFYLIIPVIVIVLFFVFFVENKKKDKEEKEIKEKEIKEKEIKEKEIKEKDVKVVSKEAFM
jgi:phosphotransferase system  glucose/maltose/N-acetylglucosamine-specific IIC component